LPREIPGSARDSAVEQLVLHFDAAERGAVIEAVR
jgi:hypothetical protein